MDCKEIGFGTYECAYNIMPPYYKVGSNAPRYIAVDKCLLPEILHLWELGIRTTGCCCGHGKEGPFIGVIDTDIPIIKKLGYKVAFNSCRPDDEDSFIPKTKLKYGTIKKGFNWWDE